MALPKQKSYRCKLCGCKTRFHVTRTRRITEFLHLGLDGELISVENEATLFEKDFVIVCGWCGATGNEKAFINDFLVNADPPVQQ